MSKDKRTSVVFESDWIRVLKLIDKLWKPATSPLPIIYTGKPEKIYSILWDVSEEIDGNFPLMKFDGLHPTFIRYSSCRGESLITWEQIRGMNGRCIIRFSDLSGVARDKEGWINIFLVIGGLGGRTEIMENMSFFQKTINREDMPYGERTIGNME